VSAGRSRSATIWTLLFLLAGVVLAASPEASATRLRSGFRDLLKPGQQATLTAARRIENWHQRLETEEQETDALAELQSKLATSQLRERKLIAELAEAEKKIAQLRDDLKIPYPKTGSAPLVRNDLLDANVLSRETADRLRQRATVDLGERDDVDAAAYVLDAEQPLLDQGETTGVAAGQEIYSARNIVGRVDRVGRWTSTFRLITDPEYRAWARLARKTGRGVVWGTAGRLEGDGEGHCRLRSISASEPVTVGDLVYSAGADGGLPAPMFYGRVIQAELEPGAVEWDVLIEPAADLENLQTVRILRQGFEPTRMMAN